MYLPDVNGIEDLRIRFNPLQAQLIPAHVTLCREDEVDDWMALQTRIQAQLPIALTLSFGPPVRDGNLAFLPATEGIEHIDDLRHRLLDNGIMRPRKQTPHVTIIHPRNERCTDAVLEEISQRLQPFTLTLREVSLIEQTKGGRWVRLAHFGNGPDTTLSR
jgi:2'-5' RNA ligase